MTTTFDSPMTARELRSSARKTESHASRVALLLRAAECLSLERTPREAIVAALAPLTRHLGIDSALVMTQAGGALTVFAGVGPVLPVGASLPNGGVLGEVTRPPMQPALREHVVSRMRVGSHAALAYEYLLPLRLAGRCHGIVALLGERGARLPDADDQAVCVAMATMLTGAVATTNTPRTRATNTQAMATITRLTAREQQVLSLLPTGASNADIATRLGIAPGTAKIHVERILHKLGVRDRTAAAIVAANCGLQP